MTELIRENYLAWRADGLTLRRIGRLCGVSQSKVGRWAEANGLVTRRPPGPTPAAQKILALLKCGLCNEEVAHRTGMSRSYVCDVRRAHFGPSRSRRCDAGVPKTGPATDRPAPQPQYCPAYEDNRHRSALDVANYLHLSALQASGQRF